MFSYRNGYEIDGSDTSYAITTPDREKCVEILSFLLRLKTVSRKRPIEATVRKKFQDYSIRRHIEEMLEIPHDEMERLSGILCDKSITSCSVSYGCQPLNALYPEVRREIVDIVAEMEGVCPKTLNEPVFASAMEEKGEFYLSLTPDGAKALIETTEKANSEKSSFPVAQTPFFAIEIGVFLGAPFGGAAYTVKKLSERFTELNIDAKNMIRRLYEGDGFYLSDKTIYERIEIETDDPLYTLRRLASFDGFAFVSHRRRHDYDAAREETSKERMELVNIPRNLAAYASKPTDTYEFRDGNGRLDPLKSDSLAANPELGILKWATGGDNVMNVEQYVAFAKKLLDVSYFTDSEFTHYTTALVYIDNTTTDNPSILRFLRKNGHIGLMLDVPCALRGYARKTYSL